MSEHLWKATRASTIINLLKWNMVAGAAVAQFSGFLLELVFYGVLQRLLEIPDFRN